MRAGASCVDTYRCVESLLGLALRQDACHAVRVVYTWNGTGEVIESFNLFCEQISTLSPRTQKRYVESLSRFIDYLYEAGAFSFEGMTARKINAAVEAFPLLLRDGSEGMMARLERHGLPPEDTWLFDVARSLNWRPLCLSSFSNTLAPINRFLALSETVARQEQEREVVLGTRTELPHHLVNVLDGHREMTSNEVARMRQNSMFGSVAKFASRGIRKPRRLTLPGRAPRGERRERDFPLAFLPNVLAAATSWRDKALWLLLGASGIRTSEAKNLLLCDVDFDEQRVFVLDPAGRRFALPRTIQEQPRFKGRTMASTYLFPPLRQQFFEALRTYLEHEFVPNFEPGRPQYLFQYVEARRRGQPLVHCSDTALTKAFKAAVEKTTAPPPDDGGNWTLHSLRHLYGVYMLNDYPLNPLAGRFGLHLVDVQMLMGHESIQSTKRYARPTSSRLIARLEKNDELILGLDESELSRLPLAVLAEIGANCD